MKRISFTKMVASGNDFIVINYQLPITNYQLRRFAQDACNRKFGIGADGLLVLEKSKLADIKMRIFNADGSEAEMCGNGARCVAFWLNERHKAPSAKLKIETKAGIIESQINAGSVKIKLTDPTDIKLDMPIRVNRRNIKVNFINTGVPHTVIFVEGLDEIDAVNFGRLVRNHPKFKPAGTNVDFTELLSGDSIKIRTYERGVEDETLACGTGAVASALITNCRLRITGQRRINVYTKSGEILQVYFIKIANKFSDIWLEGKANLVYKGEYYV